METVDSKMTANIDHWSERGRGHISITSARRTSTRPRRRLLKYLARICRLAYPKPLANRGTMYHLKIFAHGRWSASMGTFILKPPVHLRFFTAHGGVSLAHETSDYENMDMSAVAAAAGGINGHLSQFRTSGANLLGARTYQKLTYVPGDTVADYRLTTLGHYHGVSNPAGFKIGDIQGDFMAIPTGATRSLSDAVDGALACARGANPIIVYCFFCRESGDSLPSGAS
jgi:hypothetical protein